MEKVRIVYHGHACFSLIDGDYQVVLDPYSDGSVPGLENVRLRANAVYCSHGHGDHNFAQGVQLLPGSTAPYRLTVLETAHDDAGGSLRGMNKIHLFSFGNLRIAHMGDIGCSLTPEQTAALTGVDALLIPVGGYYTIDAGQAEAMVRALHPRVCIPMHYRRAHSGLPVLSGVEAFTHRFSDVRYASELELTKNTETQICVLTPNLEGESK